MLKKCMNNKNKNGLIKNLIYNKLLLYKRNK